MKVKTRIDIEKLGRRLLDEETLKEHGIVLTEENGKVMEYCMDIFLEEMLAKIVKKEKKEYTYLYNKFAEELGDITYTNELLAEEENRYL